MIPEVNDRKNAKNLIGDILRHLKVNRVIYIDDSFEITQAAESAIGWFIDAIERSPETATSLLPEVNFQAPDLAWAEEFRSSWEGLEQTRRESIITRLSQILGNYIGKDLQFKGVLKSLFPRRFDPLELSPSAWEEQREGFLADVNTENRILCLFDQDLSQADGYTATGSKSGIGLLKDLVTRYPGDEIICGLLSHTLDPENEIDEWRRYAAEQNLDLGQFLPIAKVRLSDPLSFAGAIKKTTLNLYCERLKKQAVEVMKTASQAAADSLCHLDVYDFDQIVLRSSLKEGVPESETIRRIYQIFHADHVKRNILDPVNAQAFNATVTEARNLSRIGDNWRNDRPDQRWDLRHQELFEDQGLINSFHSPIQNGDLFRLNNQDVPTFILLAQPCDLMVRSDGSRGEYGDDKVATLIPIERFSQEEFDARKPNLSVRGILPYLYKGTNDIGVAVFSRAHIVKLNVLDLVVLSDSGRCQIDVNQALNEPPAQFHTAWQQRWQLLFTAYQQHAARIDRSIASVEAVADMEIQATLRASIIPTMSLSGLGSTVNYSNGAFDFGIRRAGRLRQPWAVQLLKVYTRFLARDAEEHDFSH